MPTLKEIKTELNDLLSHNEWRDIDAAKNGLQVQGPEEINKTLFTVDACIESIEYADKIDADLLVTHHGIIWGGIQSVTGQTYKRIRELISQGTALYSSHLPLDAHKTHGNNANLLRELGCELTDTWGSFNGKEIGYIGETSHSMTKSEIKTQLEKLLGNEVELLGFGEEEVQTIAVLTGSGGDMVGQACRTHADLYITGEPKHRAHHDAKEHGINVAFGGHYHTETFGVKSLMEWMDTNYDVETVYKDIPTRI